MHDIAIIGGGINGCGVARDAAGRGYKVLLAEQDDLASGTSSWSTKLIHGGLRYLEHFEFRLVREALKEREVLWSLAPHIVEPARFVLPHHAGLRPAWLLRAGLFLYDHIGGRGKLPGTATRDLRRDAAGAPLKPEYTRGFEFSDCRVDDARLVVLNARDAAARGADIRTRTRVTRARREKDHWRLTLQDTETGTRREEQARMLVNAAGPWVDLVLRDVVGDANAPQVRLVQGSHIVVPKLYGDDHCYIFQNSDGRVVFAIPFEDDFTLIGTTDRDYEGDPGKAMPSKEEVAYLCTSVSDYFAKPVTPGQVVWSFAGVRPLFDDGAAKAQEATRDYVLTTQGGEGEPALVNIFGGKLTTYRKLAAAVIGQVAEKIGAKGRDWTAHAALPGGDFPPESLDLEAADLLHYHPYLGEPLAARLARTYGTLAHEFLLGARSEKELGPHFGAGLYEREVVHLAETEWAMTAADVLWRRTKLGLRFNAAQVRKLENWLKARRTKASRRTA